MKSTLEDYEDFVDEKGLIFHHPFYLEIVSKGNWDYATIAPDGKKIVGIFPYCYNKSIHGLRIKNYPLLKYGGPWIDPSLKETIRPSTLDNYTDKLIATLPEFSSFNQVFHPISDEPILFRHLGFSQGVRYTYIIEDLSSLDKLKSGFNQNIRRNLKKSLKEVSIEESADYDSLYGLIKMTAKRRNINMFIDYETLKQLVQATADREKGTVLLARNSSGKIMAGMFLVWDQYYMHYLVGGFETDSKNEGAMITLFFEAFKLACEKNISFDFHGSMDRQIGKFFRSFGSELKPYYTITKYNSKILLIADKFFL